MRESEVKTARENNAVRLLSLGKEVAEQATSVRDRQFNRLESVTRKQEPVPGKAEVPAENWPSLLSDLRSIFWEIQRSLGAMSDTLDRLEI